MAFFADDSITKASLAKARKWHPPLAAAHARIRSRRLTSKVAGIKNAALEKLISPPGKMRGLDGRAKPFGNGERAWRPRLDLVFGSPHALALFLVAPSPKQYCSPRRN